MTNLTGVSSTQTEQIIPAFLFPIIEARKAEDAANEQTLAQLKFDLKIANKNYFDALSANDFEPTPESESLSLLVKAADTAIREFDRKLELLDNERAASDLLNIARYDLCDKFNITPEFLDTLIEASKDVKDTLKSSFTSVFGKPTIFPKMGTTGKDLTKQAPVSTDAPKVNVSLNGENPEKPGTKGFEAYQALVSGMTYDQLLAEYPTVKDGVKDFTKLNGTVRVIIDRYKFKKQADGSYAMAAK